MARQVSCIYLFHELPPEARSNVVKEMARVVAPGGIVILNDSTQVRLRIRGAMGVVKMHCGDIRGIRLDVFTPAFHGSSGRLPPGVGVANIFDEL